MASLSKKVLKPAALRFHKKRSNNPRKIKVVKKITSHELAQFPIHTNKRLMCNGSRLCENDTVRVVYAYALWLELFKDSYACLAAKGLISNEGNRHCSNARVSSLMRGLMYEDLENVIGDLKCMLLALRGVKYGGIPKREINTHLASYGVRRTGVVWNMIGPFLRVALMSSDPIAFAESNTLIQFILRLTLTNVEGLEDKMIMDYIEFEDILHNQTYDQDLIDELRAIITEWFSHIDFSRCAGDHGYGATSSVRRGAGTDQKYQNMIPTVGTARVRQFLGWDPANELAWPNLKAKYDLCLEQNRQDEAMSKPEWHASFIQLVPKGIDKKRVISMETVNNQFFQKMLFKVMDNHFEQHPEMAIHLHNQEINRDLARYGSERYNYATIDLSSASDSVTWTLVRQLFRDTPLFYPMIWTRTSEVVLPNGVTLPIEKAYPMGSALCFPVECSVFSAARELARRRRGSNRVGGIYGDDCAIPKEYEDEFLRILHDLHFIVNRDKSYLSDEIFKEACGAECLNGYNVEPLRLPRSFDIIKLPMVWYEKYLIGPKRQKRRISKRRHDSGTQLSVMYKLSQEAYDKGYTNLYQAAVALALGYHPDAVCTEVGTDGIRVASIYPWLSKRLDSDKRPPFRWNRRYQRYEVRCEVLTSKVTRGTQAYSKCLEEMYYTDRKALNEETRIEARTGKAVTSVKYRWIPLDSLES